MPIPELESHCGSWVVSPPEVDYWYKIRVENKPCLKIVETFSRREAEMFYRQGYIVETAAQYLARINAMIKRGEL